MLKKAGYEWAQNKTDNIKNTIDEALACLELARDIYIAIYTDKGDEIAKVLTDMAVPFCLQENNHLAIESLIAGMAVYHRTYAVYNNVIIERLADISGLDNETIRQAFISQNIDIIRRANQTASAQIQHGFFQPNNASTCDEPLSFKCQN